MHSKHSTGQTSLGKRRMPDVVGNGAPNTPTRQKVTNKENCSVNARSVSMETGADAKIRRMRAAAAASGCGVEKMRRPLHSQITRIIKEERWASQTAATFCAFGKQSKRLQARLPNISKMRLESR